MQDIVTTLTHKEQAMLRAICFGRIAAHGTRLACIVGIDFHGHALMQESLVGNVAMQFSKGPPGCMPIGVALLLRGFLALLAPGTLTNVGQFLQTDETVWVLGNNAMTDLVVSILLQPSLPSTNHHKAAGSGTGAFLLQPLSQSRIVIGFGTDCLARIEG